jgi:GDP-4-dehydro-6-deoxy-D-mannose reductase
LSLRVFISGATGFVGSHLIRLLNPSEFTVYGCSYPEKPPPSVENIFFCDIRSEKEVFEAIERIKPRWIFHLAAISNIKHSWEMRKETLETNLMGTFYLFEALRQFAPEARILFVSSSDIYGGLAPPEKIFSEEDPFEIVNPYAFSKAAGEILSGFYQKIEKLDIVIARPFPHTGPGQSPDFVCSDWASQIARIEKGEAEPVIKVGNLDVRRDFTDVRDVVKAYLLLLKKGKKGEIYNVCRGKAISLREILKLLLSFSSSEIQVQTDSRKLRKADIPLLVGNNQKIKKEIGWTPEIPLERSLRDLLEYWRSEKPPRKATC